MNRRRLELRGSVIGLGLLGLGLFQACGTSNSTRKANEDAGAAGQAGAGGDVTGPGGDGSGGSAADSGGASDGGSDTSTAGAGTAEAGSDTGGNSVTFVEDFLSTTNVDLDGSTASVDTAGVGRAFGPAPYELGGFGDGSDGAYLSTSDVGATVVLAAGEHQFSSFVAHNVELSVTGDVIIRVEGDFVMEEFAFLEATGSISVYVGGQVRMPDGSGMQSLGGPCVVHQHGTAPFTILDGIISAVADGSRAEVFSRGPMLWAGGFYTRDDNDSGLSGDVIVRSGGSITIGEGDFAGYAFAGAPFAAPAGPLGDLSVYSEGDITTPDGFIGIGSSVPGQDIVVRAVGDYALESAIDASLNVGAGGTIDIIAGGTLSTNDAYFDVSTPATGGGGILVRAGSIKLGPNTNMFFDTPASSLVPTLAPFIDLGTSGNFSLEAGSTLESGSVYCAKGGSTLIRAEGDLTLGPVPFSDGVRGGDSLGSAGCSMGDGGDVTLLAGGTYMADATASILAGTGTNPGTVTALGGQNVDVGPIDPGLITWTTIQSGPLDVDAPDAVLEGATLTWAQERSEPPVLEISLDGSNTWVALTAAIGQPLSSGWKYRVRMPTGQFDAAELDRVEITYSVP